MSHQNLLLLVARIVFYYDMMAFLLTGWLIRVLTAAVQSSDWSLAF